MSEILYSAARIALLVGIGYIALCLLVYFKQGSYVYYPDKNVGLTPSYFKIPFEALHLKTPDGEVVTGWFVPTEDTGEKKTVLICHGNAGNIANRLELLLTFRNMGLNTLVFDYRGYGDSTGKPTEQGTYIDARAAWDYLLRDRGFDAGNIVLYGESLGGAVATSLAEQTRPAALILDSTFSSAPDMARRMFWYLPVRRICKFKYDTKVAIRNVKCPVLVAHSRNDEMIPFAHGKLIFEAAPDPKQFVEMSGQHNDGGIMSDQRHLKAVDEFLTRHLKADRAERSLLK